MQKIILLIVSCFLVLGGTYAYSKLNPPLTAGVGATSNDRHVVLVNVGNKGLFGDIDIKQVLVNGEALPSQLKMQVSHSSKGFIISDRFEGTEESKYTFKNVEEIPLPTGSSPQEQNDKVNRGAATDADHIFALTIGNGQTIETVTIKYRHLGISHQIMLSTKEV